MSQPPTSHPPDETEKTGLPELDQLFDFMEDIDRRLAKDLPCDLTPITRLIGPASTAILTLAETHKEDATALMQSIDNWLAETEALLRVQNAPDEAQPNQPSGPSELP